MVGASELIITINITTAIVIINFITVIITVKCCLQRKKVKSSGKGNSCWSLWQGDACVWTEWFDHNTPCYGKVQLLQLQLLLWQGALITLKKSTKSTKGASFYNKHNRVTWKFIASTRRFWKLLTQAIQGAILLIPLIFVTCRPPFFLFKRVRK